MNLFIAERLNNVHIELGLSNDSMTEIFYQENAVAETLLVGFDGSHSGQFIKVWIETTDYLTICELEVYEHGMVLLFESKLSNYLPLN